MVYAPLIFTHLDEEASESAVTITTATDLPAHLKLTHSLVYPVRTPRFITRYGYRRECGFYLRWVGYDTHEQLEPGNTLQHTFTVPAALAPSPGWGAIATSSHPLPGEPSTPPFPVLEAGEPMPGPAIQVADYSPHVVPSNVPQYPSWTVVNWSYLWPPPTLGQRYAPIPAAGVYLVQPTVSIPPNAGGSLSLLVIGSSLDPSDSTSLTYAPATAVSTLTFSSIRRYAAGDQLTFFWIHETHAPLTIGTLFMTATWLRGLS